MMDEQLDMYDQLNYLIKQLKEMEDNNARIQARGNQADDSSMLQGR
jgi:hypothetical protein